MIALVDDFQTAERIMHQFQQQHTKDVWLMDLKS
jgi:hypothetical protein